MFASKQTFDVRIRNRFSPPNAIGGGLIQPLEARGAHLSATAASTLRPSRLFTELHANDATPANFQ